VNQRRFLEIIRAAIRSRQKGQWIAWSPDDNRLVAAGESPEKLEVALARSGVDEAVMEWVEPAPDRAREAIP
jgi:hypothetical protein